MLIFVHSRSTMAANSTHDASRQLRHTRLALLSTLFVIGVTGCCVVLRWLIRHTRRQMKSTRICSLILNLVVANLSVYVFATGVQIYWELQTNRQWPFNDLLCKRCRIVPSATFDSSRLLSGRLAKFFQSFSILSSTYIIVAMAIDRCIAILTPLKAGKIRVSSLLAGLLPNSSTAF